MDVCINKKRNIVSTNCDNYKTNEDRETDSVMMSINCLNEECLIKIFEYCDIFQIQKVCSRWRDVGLRSWRTFSFYDTLSIWGIDEYGTLFIDISTLQEHLANYGRFITGLIIDEPRSHCVNPESRIQILQLNEKALSVILPYCPNLRYVKVYLKCNSIYATQFLTNYCEDLTDLILNCQGFGHFDDEKRFQDALSRLFESKKKLKRLNFKGPVREKSLESLPSDMEEIFIRSYDVDWDFLVKGLSKFHKLKKVELDGNNITRLFNQINKLV